MALELFGGAVVKAVFGELLQSVSDAKDKVSNFRNILARIEDTLKAIIPRLDEISGLNHKLDLQQKQMQELVTLIESGKALILKCSKISTFNLVKKLQYSEKLLHLDNALLRYFMTILQLDQSRDNKELLVMVRELHMKLAIDKDEEICNTQSESVKPGKDLGSGSREAGKLHQDLKKVEDVKLYDDCKMESQVKIADSKDGGIVKKIESVHKPKESSGTRVKEARKLYQSSEKGEARYLYQESITEAAPEFYQDFKKVKEIKLCNDCKMESHVKLVHNKDGGISKISEPVRNPKESSGSGVKEARKLYQCLEKGEARNPFQEFLKEVARKFYQDSITKEEYLKLDQDFLKEESVELHLDSKKEEASDQYHNFFKVGEAESSSHKYVEIKQSGMNYIKEAGKLFWLKNKSHYWLDNETQNSVLVNGGLSSECGFLCNGTYGTSYRYNGPMYFFELVIKRLKEVKVGEREFKQQIEILRKVGKHPNILIPEGFYFSAEEKLLLFDFGVAGSLYQCLHGDGSKDISFSRPKYPRPRQLINSSTRAFRFCWKSRVKIALGTARGIHHLHSAKLIHGNIESSNVLLTCESHVYLWDYSLEPIMNLSAATSGYHAPEFIETGEATQKSDVYSFGILLLEILCGRRPEKWNRLGRAYEHTRDQYSFFSCRDYIEEKEEMMGIAMQCVKKEPSKRPQTDEVVRMIKNIQTMSPEPEPSEYHLNLSK